MSNHRNDLLELHPASVVGSLLGSRPQQAVAARDAEPETADARQGALRRLVGALRSRRGAAARPETTRA
ncbi:MAG TPA: hypothetical protein VD769_04590 [Gaiellaceae bacterium]|nr:hypothetical protein [Gaiellaceae bacterium]